MLQLYYLSGSPFARIARVLALELGLDCQHIEDQGYPPKSVAVLNPALQMPTLLHGERPLFGTRLICDYFFHLGRKRPGESLPPFALGA